MKKLTAILLFIVSITLANAQIITNENIRKVATRGYAEKEVTPDIVYLSINLREYFIDGNLKKKVSIESLEKQLFDAAMSIGVKKEDFTIQNIYSFSQQVKKKSSELLQSRQYRIKVTNLNGLNTLMDKVDPQGVQSMSISGYDYSNKREIEKELKTAAVKDARANALILVTADSQSLGMVLSITDNSNFNFNDMLYQPRMMYAKAAVSNESASDNDSLNLDIKPIKLTCNIDCVYEIK